MKYNPKKIVPLKLSGQAVKFVDIPLKPKTVQELFDSLPPGTVLLVPLAWGICLESHTPVTDHLSLSE